MRTLVMTILAACSYTPPRRSSPEPVTPDASEVPIDGPAPEALCMMKYGGVNAFQLCSATAASCSFYVEAGQTCTDICAALMGTCIDGWDADCTVMQNFEGCGVANQSQVCICSLP